MGENASPATPVLRQHRPSILPLEGDIDLHISPSVTESLNAMIRKKPERIVIDLSRATYIDSAGVAALILAMQEVEAYGGKFFLSGLQETLRSIFETSRLDRIFRIFPDVDAALAASGARVNVAERDGPPIRSKKSFPGGDNSDRQSYISRRARP
jgi:anti-sigma B factor antagonist